MNPNPMVDGIHYIFKTVTVWKKNYPWWRQWG